MQFIQPTINQLTDYGCATSQIDNCFVFKGEIYSLHLWQFWSFDIRHDVRKLSAPYARVDLPDEVLRVLHMYRESKIDMSVVAFLNKILGE